MNPLFKLRPNRARGVLTDERGVSAIEFAILAPVVVFMILGTVELALDMMVDASVQLAAQTASRVGLTTLSPASGTRPDQTKAIVTKFLNGWTAIKATVTIDTLNYGSYSNITANSSQSNMGGLGDVVLYRITLTMPGFTGIPKLFGYSTLTFTRNFIVQNEK